MPKDEARFAGIKRRYPELPTTPTAMEKLGDRAETFFAKLADLPLDQMLEDLRGALQSLREVLASPDLEGALAGAHRATRTLEPTLAEARAAIADARRVLGDLDEKVKGLGGRGETTLDEMRDTFDRAQSTLETLEKTLAGADETRVRAAETLEELESAMKAIRNLVEYVQTHPEAVVLGKPRAKEEKK
jgi:paraquat-inducible protein B